MSAADAPSAPTGRRRAWPWLAAWAGVVPLAIYRAGDLTESDTFWQIRAGLLMLSTGSIPRTDSWSWTAAGEAWTMNSWGFNIVLGLAHGAGGLAMVALVCAGLAAAAIAAVLWLAARLGSSPALGAVLAIVAFSLLLGWFSARPQLIDYIALPVLVMMLRALVGSTRPLPWALACIVLTAVWMNLHAAALLAVVVAGALGVLLLFRRATRGRGWWVLATAAGMAVATVATPYGSQGYGQAGSVHGASAGVIAEWAPLNPTDPVQLAAVLIGLGGLVCAGRLRETAVAVALAITSAGGLFAIRLLPLAVLLAVAPLAATVSSPTLLARLRGLRAVTVPAVVVWFVLAGWFGGTALTHPGRPDASLYSPDAIAAIPPGCPTVNTYAVGGYLGLVRPDVLVSIDSRNDLFGAQRVLAATELVAGTGDTATGLAGAGCVIVPTGSGLAAQLAADPAWEKAAQDSIQVLYERRV